MEELDWMANHDADGPDPGRKRGLVLLRQLFGGIIQLAEQGHVVNVLLPYNVSNQHHMLGHLTVDGGGCGLVMYDSRSQDSGSLYQQQVARSVIKWNEWFVKEALKLRVELKQYVALGQQQCSWRCGYFVVLNASKLMCGQQLKQLDSNAQGALDAAAVDVYTSVVKQYLHSKSVLANAK